jgi:hypothetical protein
MRGSTSVSLSSKTSSAQNGVPDILERYRWLSRNEVRIKVPCFLCPAHGCPEERNRDLSQESVRDVECGQALLSVLFEEDPADVLDEFCGEVNETEGDLISKKDPADQDSCWKEERSGVRLTFLVLLFLPFLFDFCLVIVMLIR